MADTKISALTGATTPLAGTEVVPLVQSSTTKNVSVANLTAGRSVSANDVTLSGGTANGVLYLNGSKVATSGSALTFDGTNLGIGTTPSRLLDVSGAAPVRINSTAQNQVILAAGGSNTAQVYSNSTNALAVMDGAGSTTLFTLTQGGNLNLGVAASASNNYGTPALSVASNSYTGTTIAAHENTAAANGAFLGLMRSRGTQASPTNLQSGDLIGMLTGQVFNAAGSFPYRHSCSIKFEADGNQASGDLPGRIKFETVPAGSTTPTARLNIASGGDVTVNTGNLVIGTSGKGIDFSANTPAAGMTSQLLDDYEEGTWTPVYTPTSGAFGTIGAVTSGRYRRVGSTVFLWADIRTTGTPDLGTASGQLYITGLPFTPSALGGYGQVSIMQNWNLGTALTNLGVVVDVSNTRLYFTKNSSNSSVSYVQATELSTATDNFGNLIGLFAMYTV